MNDGTSWQGSTRPSALSSHTAVAMHGAVTIVPTTKHCNCVLFRNAMEGCSWSQATWGFAPRCKWPTKYASCGSSQSKRLQSLRVSHCCLRWKSAALPWTTLYTAGRTTQASVMLLSLAELAAAGSMRLTLSVSAKSLFFGLPLVVCKTTQVEPC